MPDQMSLPGLDDGPALFQPERIPGRPGQLRGYELFMAIFPQTEDARRIGQLAEALRTQHGLRGPCLQARHLHVSLHAIAGYRQDVHARDIDAARAAAASVVCPALPLVFDRAGSFKHLSRPGNNAFVLRCDGPSDAGVAGLRQALGLALQRAGLNPKPSNTPHTTMLYDAQLVPEHAIAPICWTATRFALILSHRGLGHHEWLGQWPLG